VRLVECIPEVAREPQTRAAILNNLPDHYAQIASEIRSKPPASWAEIETRLIDYDKGTKDITKKEVQGKTYLAQLEEKDRKRDKKVDSLEKELRDLKQNDGAALYAGGGDYGRGGNKGKGKHSGGKHNNQRQKGGGGKADNVYKDNDKPRTFLCHFCKKPGHYARDCLKKQKNGGPGLGGSSSSYRGGPKGGGHRW
jgi:hypothetical protein